MSDLVPPMMPDDLDALIQTMERVQQLEAELAKLRLTDAEREAIGRASHLMLCELWADSPEAVQDADTLNALLARLK